MANRGYFVIADITGYTAFMTGSELEHAQDILKTLFNTLHDNIKPPLVISNYQGDAILTYAPDGSFVQGQTLLESVENIYCAFATTLERMHRNTTCTCQACVNMTKLDLKVFIHHGDYVIQDMRGKAELSGPDVIIAHRMMKNEVKEKTGYKAYALFTQAAIEALVLHELCEEMKPHSETYEHIGEVNMQAYSLTTMWEREREKRREEVDPENTWLTVEANLPAPPAVAWDYFNAPECRRRFMEMDSVTLLGTKRGRLGGGSTYHCVHGKELLDLIIIDWRPFEYLTEQLTGLPMKMVGYQTTRFAPIEGGTRVTFMHGGMTGPNTVSKLMARLMSLMMKPMIKNGAIKSFQIIRQMIEEDLAVGKLTVQPPSEATLSAN